MTTKSTKTPAPKEQAPEKPAAKSADVKPNISVPADAESVDTKQLPAGAHAETVQAIEQGNREFTIESDKEKKPMRVVSNDAGAAVATVDVPAHQKEVILAQSSIAGCALAAVQAWDAVKGADDVSFAECVSPFRDKLINHAESVYTSGQVLGGDTALARFEQEVARIKGEQAKKEAN